MQTENTNTAKQNKKARRKKATRNSNPSSAIQARSAEERKDIEVGHLPSARAQVLYRLTTKAGEKNGDEKREARAPHRSNGGGIVVIMEKGAAPGADHRGSIAAAARRNEKVSVNRIVILTAELQVGINRQDIQRRNIVENEGLLVPLLTKGTVSGTENVRRETHHAVLDCQGGVYFMLCSVPCVRVALVSQSLFYMCTTSGSLGTIEFSQ